MQVTEVTDTATAREFLKVPLLIYKDDPNWIQPLNKDIEEVFDKKQNKAFRFGEAIRWVLKDKQGNLIGRIAAFANKKYKNKGDDVPVGGVGFFECIDSQDAASLMFDTAKNWLVQKGMQAMDGPINFGERERWWGLLVAGFDPPLYRMNYNRPYYQGLFENYGFDVFFKQICFGLDPKRPLRQKLHDRHAQYAGNPDFTATHISKNQLEKYATDFSIVYNKAWAGHGGAKQLSKEQVFTMFKSIKLVMDEKIIWFAYHKNEPIAMYINLPDVNQWFRHLHGKFGLLQKIKFLFVKFFIPTTKFNGIAFGVVPEWQSKGIDSFIIVESARKHMQTPNCKYTKYEMQWIGDFNPTMMNVAENLGETFHSRELYTYRYLFDRTKEFKRHPILVF